MGNQADNFYFDSSDEAESAFYSAFEMNDMSLMATLMADINVTCIHPNALPIIGRAAVLSSWKAILSSVSEAVFYPKLLHSSVEGNEVGNIAIHVVAERIAADNQADTESSLVIATNVYIKQENGWRMLSHHSSLPPYEEANTIENDPSITHSGPQTMH